MVLSKRAVTPSSQIVSKFAVILTILVDLSQHSVTLTSLMVSPFGENSINVEESKY